ncbi:MAG: hypothetical protein LBD34_00250 [Puniceicoccales bacterium]|nr:hypothetical protein [Puniceicoccales bacterium]
MPNGQAALQFCQAAGVNEGGIFEAINAISDPDGKGKVLAELLNQDFDCEKLTP